MEKKDDFDAGLAIFILGYIALSLMLKIYLAVEIYSLKARLDDVLKMMGGL